MKKLQYQYSIGLMILMLVQTASAGQQNEKEKVRAALTETIRQYQSRLIDSNRLSELDQVILAADPRLVLEELESFERDPDPDVKEEAIRIAWKVARRTSPGSEIRQEVVERLLEAYSQSETSWRAYGLLLAARSGDFSEQAKSRIRQDIVPGYPHANKDTILIIGVANLHDQIPMLKAIRVKFPDYASLPPHQKEFLYGTAEWNARLALARMGSQEDIVYCINMVEAWPDIVTRVTRLLDDLAYISQPETVRVLQKYLESDEIVPTQGDAIGGYYWEHAIELLADMLEGFPFEYKESGVYSPAELETARAWMKAQTEFKIKR